MHTQLSSESICLPYDMSLQLCPLIYVVSVSGEGSGETVICTGSSEPSLLKLAINMSILSREKTKLL